MYSNYFLASISLTILQHLDCRYLKNDRLHILYQIENPTKGKVARDERIDHYINSLIFSNHLNSAKLSNKNIEDRVDLIRLKQLSDES